jgi:hypothetical protein
VAAPFPDPETEALLVVVRQAAQEVQTALGTACPATLEVTASYSAPTDAVSACARAANENRGSISKLFRSVSHLRERTKERTGVRLPNPNNPCDP